MIAFGNASHKNRYETPLSAEENSPVSRLPEPNTAHEDGRYVTHHSDGRLTFLKTLMTKAKAAETEGDSTFAQNAQAFFQAPSITRFNEMKEALQTNKQNSSLVQLLST